MRTGRTGPGLALSVVCSLSVIPFPDSEKVWRREDVYRGSYGQKINTLSHSYKMIILCYGPYYTLFLLSHTQKHNVCQVESKEKECQLSVCSTVFSSKANWESPAKLLELFPNANMCYQINKATKDANREIRAAHLASVGRKKKWNISIKALPLVLSAESRGNRFVCFCLKIRFLKVFTRNQGPPGNAGIHHAFSLWNSPIFFSV